MTASISLRVLSLSLSARYTMLTAVLPASATAGAAFDLINSLQASQRRQHPCRWQLVVPAQHSLLSTSAHERAEQLVSLTARHISARLLLP